MTKIIVNADDFGLSKSVNKAIVDTYLAGNLSSTTLMVNMPGTQDAVALSRQHPNLGVGLHFSITEGQPLSSCPSLIDTNGEFHNRRTLIQHIWQKKVSQQEIVAELKAQIDTFHNYNIPLSHIDSHQHVHMIPFVQKCIIPIAHQHKLPMRTVNPVNQTRFFKKPTKWLKQKANAYFAQQLKKNFNGKTNDILISVHDINHATLTKDVYKDLIGNTHHNITELMVHPYILGEDLLNIYKNELTSKKPFLEKCEQEYKLLIMPNLFQDYQLITYRDI